MKTVILSIVFSFMCCAIAGCDRDADLTSPLPVGTWIPKDPTAEGFLLERVGTFPSGTAGFRFLENGAFISRQNAGWCGTPPIAYADYEGTWSLIGDHVRWQSRFWGGVQTAVWEIKPISATQIEIRIVSSEFIYTL